MSDEHPNLSPAFKPGQSGNPLGRPKGSLGLTATLKKAMKEGGSKAAVWSAIQILGDKDHRHFAAIFREVFDRIEGPVKQAIEHSISTQLMEGIELQANADKAREPKPLPDGVGGVITKESIEAGEDIKKASTDPTADGGLV